VNDMKGVSDVIAIILILMIVIALAALAYTWFTGVFTSLTASAGTAVTQTTTQMQSQFSIENARYSAGSIRVDYRNTGTQTLDETFMTAYINDQFVSTGLGTETAVPAGTLDSISFATALVCTCPNKVCTTAGAIWILTITTKGGFQQKTQVTC
jgi:flagellin-like protein